MKRNPFIFVDVVKLRELTPVEKSVYLEIVLDVFTSENDNKTTISTPRLMEVVGRKETAIKVAIKNLNNKGYIIIRTYMASATPLPNAETSFKRVREITLTTKGQYQDTDGYYPYVYHNNY